jgi:hypothetical protein
MINMKISVADRVVVEQAKGGNLSIDEERFDRVKSDCCNDHFGMHRQGMLYS